MGKRIEIEIKDGQIKVKTSGFEGKTCLAEMKKLGLEAKEVKMTSEAYQTKQKRGIQVE